MSFTPKYRISNLLLNNIARIHALITGLNSRRFPHIVLLEFERTARAVSAYASTSIEGNPLPLTEVKRLLKQHPHHIRDSEKEVLNYNAALEMLNQQREDKGANISLELILRIQKHVTDQLLPASQSGHLRQAPVVVNDPRSGRVVYLPPDVQDVPALLDELLEYVLANQGEIDPLILAGIFHKQFVIIHPFMDGNGRTVRLSTKVLLASMGLNIFNLFSFENYYNQNVTKYFHTVGEVGDYYDLVSKTDFTGWLEYFTEGIIDELLRVEKQLPQAMTPETTLKAHHQVILEIIKESGFVTDHDYAQRTNRAKATRLLDFQKLIDLGLIVRRGQSRSSHYVFRLSKIIA
ncbi:MAG: Fic family protein [Candidatus Dormibacteraceae bacterium]